MKFASIEKLAKKMIAGVESPEDSVSAILLYAESCELLGELIKQGYSIASCKLSNPGFTGYDGEYLITISDCEIFVYPVYSENGTLLFSTYDKITYIHDACSNEVLNIPNYTYYVFELAEEDEKEEDVPLYTMFENWYGEYASDVIEITEQQIQSIMQELKI